MTKKYTCQINNDQSFEIKLQDGVFHPIGTTDEIIKAVAKILFQLEKFWIYVLVLE